MTVMPNTVPEHVPIYTYVATAPTSNNFLARAKTFHQVWGLKPISVTSLEAVVSDLAKRKGTKSRIRIVTHASKDRLIFSLFPGGQKDQEITADLLNAFAQSDVGGLTILFGNIVNLAKDQGGGTTALDTILSGLRTSALDSLRPFGLDDPTRSPSGALLELFQRTVEQVVVQKTVSDPEKGVMQRALDIMLDSARVDGIRKRVLDQVTVTPARLKTLENAITAAASSLPTTPITIDSNYILNLKAASIAITRKPEKDRFRAKLLAARKRFTDSSVIDIRGCRAGAHLDYLHAVANFFGSESVKPKVTGPDYFQSFPSPVSTKFEAAGAAALVSSKQTLTGELDHWAQVTAYASNVSPTELKLRSFCDRFLFPVPDVDALGHLDGSISMLIMGSASAGSSGYSAITHWMDSQWLDPSSEMQKKEKALIEKWSTENKVPPMIALSKFLEDPNPGQETFLVPDPRYAQHIKST